MDAGLVLRERVVHEHERRGRRHYRHRAQAAQAGGRLDEEVGHGHPEDGPHAGGREQARDEGVHLRLQQPAAAQPDQGLRQRGEAGEQAGGAGGDAAVGLERERRRDGEPLWQVVDDEGGGDEEVD
eukprot:scaffold76561_cov62-Phaeocystis_antarctica.AAC.9